MLRPLQGRHALKELGVSLGRFRPLRDQRSQEPALSVNPLSVERARMVLRVSR